MKSRVRIDNGKLSRFYACYPQCVCDYMVMMMMMFVLLMLKMIWLLLMLLMTIMLLLLMDGNDEYDDKNGKHFIDIVFLRSGAGAGMALTRPRPRPLLLRSTPTIYSMFLAAAAGRPLLRI